MLQKVNIDNLSTEQHFKEEREETEQDTALKEINIQYNQKFEKGKTG